MRECILPGGFWRRVGKPVVIADRVSQLWKEPGVSGFRCRPLTWLGDDE